MENEKEKHHSHEDEHGHQAEHHEHHATEHHPSHEASHEHAAQHKQEPEHKANPVKHAAKAKPARKVHHEEHEHKVHHETKKTNYKPYVIAGLVLVVIIALIARLLTTPSASVASAASTGGKYGAANMSFYVMSQCPYGTQVEDGIQPVLAELGDAVNFELNFIGQESDGVFQSLHGQEEVDGDKLHLCVQKYYHKELMDFVVCQNKDASDLKTSIDSCAEASSIDATKIKTCAEGTEGTSLLSASFKKSAAANAQGSPTMYFNGQLYQGGRDASSFKRAICNSLDKHPSCENMPACSADTDCIGQAGKVGTCNNAGKSDASCTYTDDEAIKLIVVNAKECTSCDATQLTNILKGIFFNMEVKSVDISSSEGKTLVKNLNLQMAPSYVIEGNIEKTYAWKTNTRIQGAFTKSGSYYVIKDEASGSKYVLDATKRAELAKLVGVTTGDNKPQIDFYVMSYCPYGNMAEEAIEPVYQLLGDKAEFNPHYVIYSNYQGGGPNYCKDDADLYCSMHGIQELNQDIRELCVDKYMGIKSYFEFVLEMNSKCTAQNADTCWEDVAKGLKLDTSKIKTCEEKEWETILAKELQLNKALGVSGSPSIFVEGSSFSGGRTAADYGKGLCAEFDTAPSECSTSSLATLGTATAATGSAAAGGAGCGV